MRPRHCHPDLGLGKLGRGERERWAAQSNHADVGLSLPVPEGGIAARGGGGAFDPPAIAGPARPTMSPSAASLNLLMVMIVSYRNSVGLPSVIRRTARPSRSWLEPAPGRRSGRRLLVRRQGETAMPKAAAKIEAASFTLDGEAVVCGPDGLSRFDELRRTGAVAMLWAFDLIEHDGEDLRELAFVERKSRLARLWEQVPGGIALNEHIAADGVIVFEHACRLGAEGIVSKRLMRPIGPGRMRLGSRSRTRLPSKSSASAARLGTPKADADESILRPAWAPPAGSIVRKLLGAPRLRTGSKSGGRRKH